MTTVQDEKSEKKLKRKLKKEFFKNLKEGKLRLKAEKRKTSRPGAMALHTQISQGRSCLSELSRTAQGGCGPGAELYKTA